MADRPVEPAAGRWLNLELLPDARELEREVIDPKSSRVRLRPAAFWRGLDPELVHLFATMTSRYCIPTQELVEWLKEKIAGRPGIEIGAGQGDLGYHLGLRQTDSYAQLADPALALRLRVLGLPATRPPPDVRKLDALKAVHAYRPEVVVAAWVVQLGPEPEGQSSLSGVRETAILELADYVLIGNVGAHGEKRILALPHEEHAPPWLVSRAFAPELDRIWTWRRRRRK